MTDSKAYNMKTIVLKPVLALLTACAVFSACSNDKQDVYNNADNGITYLPLPEEMHIHPLGDVINVSYTSDEDWKVRFSDSYQDWVSMTGSGRAGTSKLSISVSPNVQSDNDRDLTISFCSTDGKVVYDEFTIFQNVAILEVNQDSFDLGWKKPEDNKAFTVTSNIQWRMTLDNASQFAEDTEKVGKLCGTLDTEFELSDEAVEFTPVENNLDPEDRTAVFTIKPVKLDKDGKEVQLIDTDLVKLTKKVSVSQDYLLFLLNGGRYDITLSGFSELGKDYVEANPDSINPEEHVLTKEFSITSEEKVTYDEDALAAIGGELVEGNHTEVELPDGRTGIKTEYTLYMTKPNPETKDFDYALKFWAVEDNTAFRTVNVKQKPYVFDLQTEDDLSSYINQGGEVKYLTVNTTGPWKLDTEKEQWEEWLSIEPTSGIGTTELTVTSNGRNLKFDDLKQVLQFSSELHGGAIVEPLEAKQAAFEFEVTEDDALHALSRVDTDPYDMRVVSSGPWKLEITDESQSGNDWLGMSVLKDGETEYTFDSQESSDTPIIVNAKTKNPYEDKDRIVKVTVYSTLHVDGDWGGKNIKTFEVKQEKFNFKVQNSVGDETKFDKTNFAAYKSNSNSVNFYLKCSAKWQIDTGGATWLSFDQTSGDGRYLTLTMTADTNTGDAQRPATVKIKADVDEDGQYDDREEVITVTQDGFVFYVEYDAFGTFGALNKTSIPVKITTTAEAGWTITCDDWIGANKKTGSSTTTDLTFTPKDNPNRSTRNDSAVIRSNVTGEEFTIPFSQEAYVFDDKAVTTLSTFDELVSKAKTQEVKVSCTEGGGWTIEKPSWIKVTSDTSTTDMTKGTGSTTLKLTVDENHLSTASDRTDYVKIKSDIGGYEKKVTVKQRKYTWDVLGMGDLELDPDEDESMPITITSSGKWTAAFDTNGSSDFVTINPASGDGNRSAAVATLKVLENFTPDKRETVLTVASEHSVSASNLSKTMKITQGGYIYKVEVEDMNFDAKDGQQVVRNLQCSGKLNVSKPSSASWITKAEISSSGVLTIGVAENKETKERNAEITIQSEHYKSNDTHRKNYQTKFKVTQEGAPEPEEEK